MIEPVAERLRCRVHPGDESRTLIFLPGIHGDWTINTAFRVALAGRARLVEFTYPRTLDWSIDDHASAIESALEREQLTSGWLLGESFGSQIVWPLLERKRIGVEGVVLAGGFGRHPWPPVVRLMHRATGLVRVHALRPAFRIYALAGRLRYRDSPEMAASVREFLARRTELDWQAVRHRLRLIESSDPSSVARRAKVPVFYISGALDPIVPWHASRRWLRKNCPGFREARILPLADHHVLGSGARAAAEQVLRWMASS